MLAEERHERITSIINRYKSVTVQELTGLLNISESTVRRDLKTLDKRGDIVKVHGGAVAVSDNFLMRDDDISERRVKRTAEKRAIARYAAALVKENDFVFVDAGTTTEYMIEYLTEKKAIYVTNAVTHARRLAHSGFEVYLVGGMLKGATEAVVGAQAIERLLEYNFTVGFWGTNGIHAKNGFTTPDNAEATVKRISMKNCKKSYVLADSSKFGVISPVRFAGFEDAYIITERVDKAYAGYKNIIVSPTE